MLEEEQSIVDVFKDALKRHYEGHSKYGQWQPDKKDWLLEMEEELMDVIMYAIYQILKLRKWRQGGNNANSH